MKIIKTKNNQEIIVDDHTYFDLVLYKWHVTKLGYAARTGQVMMHRELTNCPRNMTVHHINGNKLDNRLENLEVMTRSEASKRIQERIYQQKHFPEPEPPEDKPQMYFLTPKELEFLSMTRNLMKDLNKNEGLNKALSLDRQLQTLENIINEKVVKIIENSY